MSKKLLTNLDQCAIASSLNGVRDVLVFQLDVEALYNADSQCFGDIREDESFRHERIIFLQLFFRLLEETKNATSNKIEEQQKKKSIGNTDTQDDITLRPLHLTDRDANDPHIDPISAIDQLDDDKSIQSGDEDNAQVDKFKQMDIAADVESDKEESDEEKNLPRKSTSLFETYIESIADSDWEGDDAPQKITAYRFWAINYCESVNVNTLWANIVKQAFQWNKAAIERKNRRNDGTDSNVIDDSDDKKQSSRPSPIPVLQPHQQWKRLASHQQLVGLLDSYVGRSIASEQTETIASLDLSSNMNPLCATQIFNLAWAMGNTRNMNVYKRQGFQNRRFYIRMNEFRGLRQIFWPERKLVYKLHSEDIQTFILLNKYLPFQDKLSQNFCSNILPILLEDTNFLKDDVDIEEDETVTKEKKREDDEKKKRIDRQMNSFLNECGIPITNFEKIKPFNNNDLYTVRWEIIEKILGLKSLKDTLFSAYGPIYAASKKNKIKIQNLYAKKDESQFLKKLKDVTRVTLIMSMFNRDTVFSRYIAECKSEKSNISPCGKIMMREAELQKLLENQKYFEKVDPTLSIYADWECRFYLSLDKLYGLINSHTYASLAYKNTLDAYNMDFNRVHNNMITYSEGGATGKSYLWSLLVKHFRIPDTVNVVTYESAKSRAVDGVYNDQVIIFDEIEKAIMDSKKSGDGDKERTWKMLLSNNKVSARILVIDPITGQRQTKVTFSEQITVFLGSTNVPLSCMSVSMGRRFHLITVDEKPYSRKSIPETQANEAASGGSSRGVYRSVIDKHHHLVQVLVYHVEKLIYLGGLTDVTMDVANIIILHLSNELLVHGYVEPNPTMYERIMTTARVNTILDALYKLFFYKGSKYQGKFIKINDLKDLEPYLFCNSQNIVSAIGETMDVLIDPLEHQICAALKIMHRECPTRVYKYKSQKAPVMSANGDLIMTNVTIARWLRFRLDKTLPDLARRILTKISALKDKKITPSIEAIMDKLRSWTKRDFKAYQYEFVRETSTGLISTPEGIIIVPPFEKEPVSIAVIEEHFMYVHYQYIYSGQAKEFDSKKTKLDVKYSVTVERCDSDASIAKRRAALLLNPEYLAELEKNASIPRYHEEYYEKMQPNIAQNLVGSTITPEHAETCENQKRFNSLDMETSPSDFIGEILKDLLTRKFQLPQRLTFTHFQNYPSIRSILEIPEPAIDASYIIIPVVNHISAVDCRVLAELKNFIDVLSTKKYWLLDCDIDSFGIRQRKLATYFTPNPISKIILSDNPLEDFFQQKEKKKQKKLSEEKTTPIANRYGTILQKNSAFTLCNIDEDESGDEVEELNIGRPSYSNLPDYLVENIGVPQLIDDIEDDFDVAQTEGQINYEELNDELGIIPRTVEENYDMTQGYFIFTPLIELCTDDSKTIDKLSRPVLKRIYEKLDDFDPNDIFDDVTFEIARYVLDTKENGDPYYHWDALADEKEITLEIYKNMKSKDTSEMGPYIFVKIGKGTKVTHELELEVLRHNVRMYKEIYMHPQIQRDFENRKYYSGNKQDYNMYPKCMFESNIIMNRDERWSTICDISKDENAVKHMMYEDDDFYSFGFKRKVDAATGAVVVTENNYPAERFVTTVLTKRNYSQYEDMPESYEESEPMFEENIPDEEPIQKKGKFIPQVTNFMEEDYNIEAIHKQQKKSKKLKKIKKQKQAKAKEQEQTKTRRALYYEKYCDF